MSSATIWPEGNLHHLYSENKLVKVKTQFKFIKLPYFESGVLIDSLFPFGLSISLEDHLNSNINPSKSVAGSAKTAYFQ